MQSEFWTGAEVRKTEIIRGFGSVRASALVLCREFHEDAQLKPQAFCGGEFRILLVKIEKSTKFRGTTEHT